MDPGPAFAPSSRVPAIIEGEVGERTTTTLRIADRAGNCCTTGEAAAKAVVSCTSLSPGLEAKVEKGEAGDGDFVLSWYAKAAGTYETSVTVNGRHVVNSPTRIVMKSTRPVISKSKLSGPGLVDAEEHQATTSRVLLLDSFDNVSVPGADFKIGLSLLNPKDKKPADEAMAAYEHAHGAWIDSEDGNRVYEITYTPSQPGVHQLYVWCEHVEGSGKRTELFQGMPMTLNIDRSMVDGNGAEGGGALDSEAAKQEALLLSRQKSANAARAHEGPINAPGDYTIVKDVFEEIQAKWGGCTIDAFSSEITALLPRYWTAEAVQKRSEEALEAAVMDARAEVRIQTRHCTEKCPTSR